MMKHCPRCNEPFDCKSDNILECSCMLVPLSAAERRYIAGLYSGCLCSSCLYLLKQETTAQAATLFTH